MKSTQSSSHRQLRLAEKTKRSGTKARLVEMNLGYGGEINYRKCARPFSALGTTHVVLQSSLLTGARSLLKQNRKTWVEDLVRKKVAKYFGSLYELSINSNHIHMLTQFKTKELQARFLKDFSGTLALKIRKAFKLARNIKVWDQRPFTRLYKSSNFTTISNYIRKNRFEALGLLRYSSRPESPLKRILKKEEPSLLARNSWKLATPRSKPNDSQIPLVRAAMSP